MKRRNLSVVVGTLLAASVGTASADSIVLTDSEMDAVTAGVGFTSFTQVDKIVNIQEIIIEQKAALFDVFTTVVGWSAVAEAEADAEGPNSDAQTFSFAEITPSPITGWFKANSLSKSIALVSN